VRVGVVGQKKNHEDGSQNDSRYGQLVGEIHKLSEILIPCDLFDSTFNSFWPMNRLKS
jgi:hypothetical protein